MITSISRSSLIFLVFFVCFAPPSFGQELSVISEHILTGSVEQKRSALHTIRNIQTASAARLAIPALTDMDEIVRATAASAVIFLPKDEAARLLEPLVRDRSEFVRREAAFALGHVGNRSSARPLLELMQKDTTREVRAAAAAALGRIGDPAAVNGLTSVLRQKPGEDFEFVRRSAARSIGQIAQTIKNGRPDVVTPMNFLDEKYKEIKPGNSGPFLDQFAVFREAAKVLSRVLQDGRESDDTRREAAFALGAIGDPSAISALHTCRGTGDIYLGEICKEALLKMPKPQ